MGTRSDIILKFHCLNCFICFWNYFILTVKFLLPQNGNKIHIRVWKRSVKESECYLPCGYYRQKMQINYELQERSVIRGVRCCCDRGI
jgi:hypothetical protein